MAIVNFSDLIKHASEHHYALNVFPVGSLAELSAITTAAHAQRASVILAPTPNPNDRAIARALFAACEVAATDASVPVALLGFPGDSADASAAYINQGCGALHLTPAPAQFPDAVEKVKALGDIGKQCGIAVGALLPAAPVTAHPQSQEAKPTVAECIAFAQRSELDFLEVDWIDYPDTKKKRAKADYDRLKRINEALGRMLLIRVEDDVSPEQIYRVIEYGVVLACHAPSSALQDTHKLQECFKVWGSAGRAAEVLTHCRPWQTAEHVVEFNIRPDAHSDIDNVLAAGREQLARIPGVRRVATGRAIAADARYQYCWIVTFASEKVVEFYRNHPIHVEFADHRFRPIADDRSTIDFQMIAS